MSDEWMEPLAEAVHQAYCLDFRDRKGTPYWTNGDYSLLSEETKEIDRKTVRAVLNKINYAHLLQLQQQLAEAEQRERVLQEFARHVIKTECWAVDGAEIQDLAERLGLIVPHVATAEDVDIDFDDFEVGDTIFKFSEALTQDIDSKLADALERERGLREALDMWLLAAREADFEDLWPDEIAAARQALNQAKE